MNEEKWPGAAAEALAALIARNEAQRARQLQELLDLAERDQDMTEVLAELQVTEESLAVLRSQQAYRRLRGGGR